MSTPIWMDALISWLKAFVWIDGNTFSEANMLHKPFSCVIILYTVGAARKYFDFQALIMTGFGFSFVNILSRSEYESILWWLALNIAKLTGESGTEIVARLKRDLASTMINGVMYWPLCDFVTFKFVPVHLQVSPVVSLFLLPLSSMLVHPTSSF